jgi:hypothetical protein
MENNKRKPGWEDPRAFDHVSPQPEESKRRAALESMKTRYPWEKDFKQLTKEEYDILDRFVTENDHLDRNAFAEKANRLFLDAANKPKRWTTIVEILININVHAN